MGERFSETASIFEKEAGIHRSFDGQQAGLLEKKWTSVIRLQKKVMELEAKIQQMEENTTLGNVISRRDTLGLRSKVDFLPRGPPKYSLSGHRNPITVRFLFSFFSFSQKITSLSLSRSLFHI